MKTWWNWRPRERMERDKRRRNSWRTKEIHHAGNGQETFFEEALLVFEAQDQMYNGTQGLHQPTECNPALLCHPWWEKKSFYPDITQLFCQDVDRTESSKEPEPEPSTTGMSDTAAGPPSHTADDLSALPPPTSSPSSSQYLFLPVHARPAAVLHYCNFQSTVLYDENCFIFCAFLKCIICVKSIINLLQYSTIQLIVLVGDLG